MTSPQSPHDRFFRYAFSKREVARPFFERYLPSEVVDQLALDTLALADGSFVDEELQAHHSDLLFKLQTHDQQPVRLYLLLEHKSYNDPWVGLQLQRYLNRIWERERESVSAPPLPAIMPIVLYHGDRAWSGNQHFAALIDTPVGLSDYTPSFRYLLVDLTQQELDDLQ